MPAGSLQQWLFTMTTTAPGGTTPYPVSGATWEYVARTSPTDTGTPLITITAAPSPAGALTVTATAAVSSVLLNMYPAATAAVTPGTYWHALYSGPGTTTAFAWFTGELIIAGNPQP
jgi:hypothetical protein